MTSTKVTTKLNQHLHIPVSTKVVEREWHKQKKSMAESQFRCLFRLMWMQNVFSSGGTTIEPDRTTHGRKLERSGTAYFATTPMATDLLILNRGQMKRPTPAREHLAPRDLAYSRPPYTVVPLRNRVSNLGPSGTEAESYHQGNLVPKNVAYKNRNYK
ncbi:hypothetical protein AVEN_96461-1 [Araneus ventricosus]|uniref:Uncharacterized protein n=1 Tax=Araneus ventricosus TaxID=182803 RepID=A0A4Y2S8A8_ARAVE|nr:hypothetical protein AVEN_96461-1 [Araneus ventricosus]